MLHPVAEQYVVAAEQRLGVAFPVAYRRFLMKTNGGGIEIGEVWWDLHPVADDSDPRRIGPTWDHVCRQTDLARMLGGFPEGAVAIGEDGSGDRLVLLRCPARGALELAVWRHDTGRVVWSAEGIAVVFAGT